MSQTASPDYSTFGKAWLHWLLTNALAILVLKVQSGLNPSEPATFFGESAFVLPSLFYAFLSLLFAPMVYLLMAELLAVSKRNRRILLAGVAIVTAYLLVCFLLICFFALTSHAPFLTSIAAEAVLLFQAWPYLLAVFLATLMVYWRGLFRTDSTAIGPVVGSD